jgi:hypothetical protein
MDACVATRLGLPRCHTTGFAATGESTTAERHLSASRALAAGPPAVPLVSSSWPWTPQHFCLNKLPCSNAATPLDSPTAITLRPSCSMSEAQRRVETFWISSPRPSHRHGASSGPPRYAARRTRFSTTSFKTSPVTRSGSSGRSCSVTASFGGIPRSRCRSTADRVPRPTVPRGGRAEMGTCCPQRLYGDGWLRPSSPRQTQAGEPGHQLGESGGVWAAGVVVSRAVLR